MDQAWRCRRAGKRDPALLLIESKESGSLDVLTRFSQSLRPPSQFMEVKCMERLSLRTLSLGAA